MIDGDDTARSIWIILVLLLVASSLTARRIPVAKLIAGILTWVVLFSGAYLAFQLLSPRIIAWQEQRRGGQLAPSTVPAGSATPQSAGASITISMADDGHFWVDALAKGRKVRFLVDSGASITALSRATADELGLETDPMGGIAMQTANGEIVAQRSSVPLLELGPIRATDLPVAVSAAFGETNVLGMNFLSKLRSWRVENGEMVLQAQ